ADGSGELNTAPATTSAFVPTASQWAPKIYSLPAGTNRVRLRAESGWGNNLYLDNICVQALPLAVANNIGICPEGFYRNSPPQEIPDTFRVYLRRVDFPNITVDSSTFFMTSGGNGFPLFNKALSGNYYLVFKHRNSLETWTNAGVFNYTRGNSYNVDIINNNSLVYGGNQALMDPLYGFYGNYSGDVNYDNIIDIGDLAVIDNDANNFASGYVISDINGDNFVDVSDYALADNNAYNIVTRQAPPGAEPSPAPVNNDNPEFKTDAEREKYEMAQKIMREKGITEEVNKVQEPVLNEVLKLRKERDQHRTKPVRNSETDRVQMNKKSGSFGLGFNSGM
ncbi:MAG: hypothetical protein JSS91_08370, partial [Bacteroidetes bacterium]|nr:hypothetical protein [Bacteroidota bacterium]